MSEQEEIPDREFLQVFVAAYLHQAGKMSYPQLKKRQGAPTVSLFYGCAGLAFAFWYVGTRQKNEAYLQQAKRWGNLAARHQEYRYAFRKVKGPTPIGRLSVFYGRPGVPLVRALVASSLGEPPDKHVDAFIAMWKPRRKELAEFLQGAAGYLAAVTLLQKYIPGVRLTKLGNLITDEILKEGSPFYCNLFSFAHGRIGVCYSLLQWSLSTGYALPPSFLSSLEGLEQLAPNVLSESLPRSWCNGGAGFLLFLTKAYQYTGDKKYLHKAREVGNFISESVHDTSDLCCGLGGRSFALLKLEEIDPINKWKDKALLFCVDSINQFEGTQPNSLFRGYLGLVCVAVEGLVG